MNYRCKFLFSMILAVFMLLSGNLQVSATEYEKPVFTKPYFSILADKINIKEPELPDISGYTLENMKKKMPKLEKGVVRLGNQMDYWYEMGEFTKDGGIENVRKHLRQIWPKVIAIDKGHYNLSQVYEIIDNPDYLEKLEDGTMILKVPLLVGFGASLRISGEDTKKLLVSQDRFSYILSTGELFIYETRISGWNIKNNDYSWYENENIFRPYISVWNGGELYIANSEITHMGYKKRKSYGISYAPVKRMVLKYPDRKPATGWIIGSKFSDMYFGFYCYEAEDIAIINNVYADNIIYGIDPHDRSKGLIIANNEAYGSKEKHGIIISREVNDSWIFNNYSHNNKGSGIMLDRSSENNVIAYNISIDNGGDGLVFFESPHNLSYKNKLNNNAKNGIRIRNSWDIISYGDTIVGNGQYAVNGYVFDLEKFHKHRDLEMDPYSERVNASFFKSNMQANGIGTFNFYGSEFINVGDIDIFYPQQSTFMGEYSPIQNKIIPEMNKKSYIHISRIKK